MTPAQIIAALIIANRFDILNPSAPINFSQFTDITNWAGIGISSGAGDTAKIIAQILDPTGAVCYQNAGYANDNYSSPDTELTGLVAPQFTLPVFTGTSTPLYGIYTFNLKCQVVPNGQSAVVAAKQFSVELSPSLAPSLQLQETFNCNTATYTSQDITQYGAPAGFTISNITRSHVVTPPQAAIAAGQTAVTSSAATVTLGAPSNQLWTGTYAVNLEVDITYTNGNHTTVVHLSLYGHEQLVVCDTAYCKLQCCLNDLIGHYNQYLGQNQVLAQDYYKKWQLGTQYFFAIIQAAACNNAVAVSDYTNKFYAATGCSADCSCDCTDQPGPVIPTTVINGTNGANGLSFYQGSGVPAGGLGQVGDSYLDYSDPTGQIYHKTAASTWTPTFQTKGATGATGAAGAAGTNGTNGVAIIETSYANVSTTTTAWQILNTLSTDPSNTAKNLTAVGQMMELEATFSSAAGADNTRNTRLRLTNDGNTNLITGLNFGFYASNIVKIQYRVQFTRTGTNTIRVEAWVNMNTEVSGIESKAESLRIFLQDIASIDFTKVIDLGLEADSGTIGDITLNTSRLTIYKV